jgi:multisubunit Na+/H+ antiporter MnhB subunit
LLPSHYAAFARATVLLGGANSVSAVLVLVAVLLVVVSGDAAKQRPRVQDWAAALGMVVAFGAVVMAAMTIWYYTGFHQVAVRERLSVELRSVGALVAAALIAGAASWWALAGRTA